MSDTPSESDHSIRVRRRLAEMESELAKTLSTTEPPALLKEVEGLKVKLNIACAEFENVALYSECPVARSISREALAKINSTTKGEST